MLKATLFDGKLSVKIDAPYHGLGRLRAEGPWELQCKFEEWVWKQHGARGQRLRWPKIIPSDLDFALMRAPAEWHARVACDDRHYRPS
jgi:hypothetical protein